MFHPDLVKLSPLAQYSADDGHLTSWHMAHRKLMNLEHEKGIHQIQWAASSRVVLVFL
jgi:hypothetical protein